MSYYYSGNVRKRFVSQTQLQIEATRRANRRENLKNILLISVLIGCFIAAGILDGSSIREGLLH